MIYTAAHLSLAALKMLVHLPNGRLLATYASIPVEFPEELVEDLATLPENWRVDPAPVETQRLGDLWAQQNRSVAFRVPSVIVSREFNYVLNPRHPSFAHVRIGTPEAYGFDQRLIKTIAPPNN